LSNAKIIACRFDLQLRAKHALHDKPAKKPLGVSDLANALNFHKSTVYNAVHTLDDLRVLENDEA